MKRKEAMLRELNLHPVWVKRSRTPTPAGESNPPPAAGRTPAPAVEAPPAAPAIAADPMTAALPAASPEAVKAREEIIHGLAWPDLKHVVRDCTACKLRATCTQTVFGVGDEKATWLFVGEGPGADEDIQGEPFVGQAGKLLDNMLMSIKLKRGKSVYIANIVKCRPPNNRTPEADEIATCIPYLKRQIDLIGPKIIVALGKTAATSLLGREATLGSVRGKVHDCHGIPLIVTYHPAYLLRTPMDKAKAWEDLCLAVETMKNLSAAD